MSSKTPDEIWWAARWYVIQKIQNARKRPNSEVANIQLRTNILGSEELNGVKLVNALESLVEEGFIEFIDEPWPVSVGEKTSYATCFNYYQLCIKKKFDDLYLKFKLEYTKSENPLIIPRLFSYTDNVNAISIEYFINHIPYKAEITATTQIDILRILLIEPKKIFTWTEINKRLKRKDKDYTRYIRNYIAAITKSLGLPRQDELFIVRNGVGFRNDIFF